MIAHSSSNSSTADAKYAGRVVFAVPDSKDFLFFVPSRFDRSLRLLQESMWFKIENPDYGQCYRAASSIEALEWLRDTLGPLRITPEVHEWYKKQTEIVPIPEIASLPLYEFQREAVGFLLPRERAMLSLSPGLGKTITSITAATLLPSQPKRILVVSPVSLLYMWKSELERWQPNLSREFKICVWHKKIDRKDLEVTNPNTMVWVIINPETVIRQVTPLSKYKFDLMIIDESIFYKNRKAKRTKAMQALAKVIPIVWELTGAPANRMVDDLWSQFNILKPKAYSSYWRFSDTYCMTANTGWGNQVLANKVGTEETIKRRFRDIYFARSQEEVLDIPNWLFENIEVPMTNKQEKIYFDLSVHLRALIEKEGIVDRIISVGSHLEKIIRLVQAASNPVLLDGEDSSGKWEALPELIDFFPKPFIFWTSFIRSNHLLADKLRSMGLRVGKMLGETLPQDRQSVVDEFQKGKLDAIVVGQAVGSFGHTLTAARTAFYIERNFDGSYFQSLHRFRRIGTTQSPVVVNLMSIQQKGGKTIDHLVHSLLDYRVEMIQNLTTGMLREIL